MKLNLGIHSYANAPLLVLIAGEKFVFAVNHCTMSAQNMMLAAYSMGIWSCWIGLVMGIANDPKVKKELRVPDDHEVYSALILGYPKGKNDRASETATQNP
jgi:nitroreductase